MPKQTNQPCLAFICHNVIEQPLVFQSAFESLLQFFRDMNYPQPLIGYMRNGKRSNPGTYRRRISQINVDSWESMEYVILGIYEPGPVDYIRKFIIEAGVSSAMPVTDVTLTVLTRAISDWELHLQQCVTTLLSTALPAYGYKVWRDRTDGPSLYLLGIVYHNPNTPSDAESIMYWNNAIPQQVWLNGYLRDVYFENYLTFPQWGAPVGDISLQEWISQDPSRGSIEQITPYHICWRLSDDQIPAVRERLIKADRIWDKKHWTGARLPREISEETIRYLVKLGAEPDANWEQAMRLLPPIPGQKPQHDLPVGPPPTPEEVLALILGEDPPENFRVLRGKTAEEIPAAEVKAMVKKGRSTRKKDSGQEQPKLE